MTLNADNDIMGIFFSAPVDLRATVESLLPGLAGGDAIAYLVMKDGEVLHAMNEDEPLAVGSAFKLGILAVHQRPDRGRRARVGPRRGARGGGPLAADRARSRRGRRARR